MNLSAKKHLIPENELHISFARSSGAGGQNVNKTSTKVIIHWSVGKSRVFTWEQKYLIRMKLANRLNWRDEIVVTSEGERSQLQNREEAVMRLQTLVKEAIKIPKKRRPTKPTRSSKRKRLDSKKLHSEIKQSRRAVGE